MSTFKKLAPFCIALVAVIGLFAYVEHERIAPQPIVQAPAAAVASTTVQSAPPAASASLSAVATHSPAPVSAPASTTTANATLKVGNTAYPLEVSQGETVIAAMRALAASSTFTFIGHDYPTLGFFVDSINGEKNADGKYWMLYLNGVSATTGASALMMSPGDIVEWKYEKGY